MNNSPVKTKGSLERAVFLMMYVGAIVLLLMAGAVVLVLYPYTILRGIKRDTRDDMRFCLEMVDSEYLAEVFARSKEIYYGLSDEETADPFSEEFKEHFKVLTEDPRYRETRGILSTCRTVENLGTIAFCFFDADKERIVFVIDGDSNDMYYIPGQWVSDDIGSIDSYDEVQRIKRSDWYMSANFGQLTGWTLTNYVEIKRNDGEVIGLAYTDVNVSDFLKSMGAFTLFYLFLVLIVMVLMLALISSFLRNRIVIPMARLSGSAMAYTARDKTVMEDRKSYFAELDIRSGDEMELLWRSLVDMEEDIHVTMRRIREMTSVQERLNTELAIASQIQTDILPRTFPPFPDRHEFSLYARMKPARDVGGDFYDFFLTDDDHIALVIADVSDKGIPAALFMMTARSLIKGGAMKLGTPAEVVSYANAELCSGNEAAVFVTVWMAIIEISTGRGMAVNAGHMHPALCRKDGRYELVEYEHDLPLGLVDDAEFTQHEFQLEPGDRLFVYTDGVTDALDKEDKAFGTDGMLKALNEKTDDAPEETLNRVMDRIKEFAVGAEQTDDMTALGFCYLGP